MAIDDTEEYFFESIYWKKSIYWKPYAGHLAAPPPAWPSASTGVGAWEDTVGWLLWLGASVVAGVTWGAQLLRSPRRGKFSSSYPIESGSRLLVLLLLRRYLSG